MDLPVKFPTETEVILEDVARVRALSPEERMRAFRKFLADENDRINRSPDAAAIWARHDEERRLNREAILEFIARHAHLVIEPDPTSP